MSKTTTLELFKQSASLYKSIKKNLKTKKKEEGDKLYIIGIAGDLTYSLAQKSIPDGPDSIEKTNRILEEYDLQELIVS